MGQKKYCAFPGRFQSPHRGHRWLIEQRLRLGECVSIWIRDVVVDKNNPFTANEVKEMLSAHFKEEIKQQKIHIMIIPDIKEIVTGRGVGYSVTSLEDNCPEHIKRISATEIRRQIRAGEDDWRDVVMPGVEKWLEEKFSND